jgi:hypothetical protein
MTLIEVVVALVIVVIVSVVMVAGFTTMANLDMKNSDQVRADSGLSEVIAISGVSDDALPEGSPYSKAGLAASQITLTNAALPGGALNISIKSKRYTDPAVGSGYTIFDFEGTTP